ncbi:MAG: isoprenylcysteine carboxylmethyltransferase family protein [Pirellulales bacterium]
MTDNTARIVLLIGFAVVTPIGIYHRLRAATGERLDRRQEGWWILLTMRPLALLTLIATAAYIVRPGSMAWSSVPLPGWLRWAGVALGIAAAGLLVWTFRALGRNLTDTVVTRRNASLVTNGPYRWVRHPFYVSFALGAIANALVTANWILAITGIGVFVLLAIRARIEERNLIARFGREYEEYMTRTGRFLPRLS